MAEGRVQSRGVVKIQLINIIIHGFEPGSISSAIQARPAFSRTLWLSMDGLSLQLTLRLMDDFISR
jgi:hypothetical protein